MAEFKRIALAQIGVPPRLRAVEEEHALAIAQSIVEHGLLTPVAVRATPAAKTGPYTLVAGAHRLRATEINGDSDIEAVVVEADKAEALLMEITENLFRNELSVIDRAVFVGTYRDEWQKKHGAIRSGPKGNQGQLVPNSTSNLVDLIAAEADTGFAQHVAERLGISSRSVKRLNLISKKLHADIRNAARGTPLADNQSALLKIARFEPVRQRQIAAAWRDKPDLKLALSLSEPNAKAKSVKTAQEKLFETMTAAWRQADAKTRAKFLAFATAPAKTVPDAEGSGGGQLDE